MNDDRLGPPPQARLEIVADHTATSRCDEGFLRLKRLTLRHTFEGHDASAPYRYDVVDREALDAVALVLVDTRGPRLCLRTALRPPLGLRADGQGPVVWEIPAGLLELGETVEACAARETFEETGLVVPASAFEALGPAVALAPGVLGEKLHFRAARVDASRAEVPPSDGHPVEQHAEVRWVSFGAAFDAVARGDLVDIKSELALHRARVWLGLAADRGGALAARGGEAR